MSCSMVEGANGKHRGRGPELEQLGKMRQEFRVVSEARRVSYAGARRINLGLPELNGLANVLATNGVCSKCGLQM